MTVDADGRAKRLVVSAMEEPLSNRLAGAGGTADAAAWENGRANAVADFARGLRDRDKTLSLNESYRRAQRALDPVENAAGSLILANRARELRTADKSLSLSASCASLRVAIAKAADEQKKFTAALHGIRL